MALQQNEEQLMFKMKSQKQNDLMEEYDEMQKVEKRIDDEGKLQILTEKEVMLLQKYLMDIPIIGTFGGDDTPLDYFDSECHDQDGGII